MSESSQNAITASYSSGGLHKQISIPISAAMNIKLNPASTDAKTHYLASMRTATAELQTQVNTFLTDLMEKDKLEESGVLRTNTRSEDKAEEMYGEESIEDEA